METEHAYDALMGLHEKDIKGIEIERLLMSKYRAHTFERAKALARETLIKRNKRSVGLATLETQLAR